MRVGSDGLLIGAVAARSGVSRKAIRLYEAAGILARPARTRSGYRLYPPATLAVLGFVAHARRLGFTLAEIREIGALVRRKALELDRALRDLTAMRRRLRRLLQSPSPGRDGSAVVCPHIEAPTPSALKRRTSWKA